MTDFHFLTRRRLRTTGIIAIALLVCVAVFATSRVIKERHTFDAKVWQALPEEKRGRMAEDIVQRRLLDGMTSDNVKALLGIPSYERESIVRTKFYYYVGEEYRLFTDKLYLTVEFTRGRVLDVGIADN